MATVKRRRLRLVVAGTFLALLLWGGWMLLRGSSLVGVRDVTVVGLQGRQADEIRGVLEDSAQQMTTLNVRSGELMEAMRPYPVVNSLRTERDLPHGLKIIVNAYDPVAAVEVDGKRTAVAADGTLLRGTSTKNLPRLRLKSLDGSGRLTDRRELRAVRLLADAPPPLRKRIERVFQSRRGLSTTLRNGPKLYFGGGAGFGAKWAAASKVLADSSSLGASYIDVRVPERPSAGGLAPPAPEPEPEAAAPVG